MPLKLLNSSLLIVAIIGGIFTYQAGQEYRHLQAEVARLANKVGDLDIEDPTKVYVKALHTGEDLHFAWRIYLPAGFRASWQHNYGGTSGEWYSDSCEFISRVRFYEDDNGNLMIFRQNRSSGGTCSFNRKQGDLLRGRWDEIEVEQLGSDGVAVVEPDEVALMLRLTLSEELKREAEQKLSKYSSKRLRTELFSLRFGSDQAFEQSKASMP